MEQRIILILMRDNHEIYGGTFYDCIYGGTFYDCTYEIKDIEDDSKYLMIFNKGNCIYRNNSKNIEIKEGFDDISEVKEITITLYR